MSSLYPKITLGTVPYLNARPLVATLKFPLIEAVPSRLLEIFQLGEVDAALLSSYDVLCMPDAEIVDDIAIGCCGEVYSVILVYEGALKNIKRIRLDPSSHTSNNLLKVILAEFYDLHPEFVINENYEDSNQARLIIGDPAIAFRQNTSCSILDLGEEWFRFTGLPFVFALWCFNKNSSYKTEITEQLQLAKKAGLSNREKIVATQLDPVFALRYLTDYIRYDVGDQEKQGIELFRTLLLKHHLI